MVYARRVEPRAASHVRCAYCHAPVFVDDDDDDDARTCDGCRTIVHADCLATNGGCPTLGCTSAPREPLAVATAPKVVEATRAPGVALLVTLAGVALSVVATGALSAIGLLCATGGLLVLVWFSPWARPGGPALPGPLAGEPPVAPTTVTTIPDLDAALARPDAWLECDDPDAVIEAARWALRGSPGAWVERLRLALAHEVRHEDLEADLHLAAVLDELAPDDQLARYGMALAHVLREDHVGALGSLSDPHATAAWGLRARLRRCAGDLDGALADAEEAVRRCSRDDPWPFEARARLRSLAGSAGLALEDAALSVARATSGQAGPHLTRGVLRSITGDVPGACRDLHVALGRAPRWPLPRRWLAALGEDVDVSCLERFAGSVARCLVAGTSAEGLLAEARDWPWGERAVRKRLRLAHGLLGVAAGVRGAQALARAHAMAVCELGDDGTHVCDWALVLARRSAS